MQLPLAHLDASVLEEVPLPLWTTVLDAVGWPASIAGNREGFTHDDLLRALQKDDPTDDLLLAIETLHLLGTESGRTAIGAAITDRRVDPTALPQDLGPRELALHLFLAQRTNPTLVDVFARAQAQMQEGGERRPYNEFMGQDARPIRDLPARRDALKQEIVRYCKENDLGEHVHLRDFEEEGVYVFHVVRSHRTKKPLAVVPGRAARATIEFRPVHGDILRYEAAVGRLRVAARAASMVEFYRRACGRVLFDDEQFFTGDPACSLRVLQDSGRIALDRHNIPGIGRVRMTECLWERGDRELVHIRAPDCFRNIEELKLPLAEGMLLRARLKVEVSGRSTRPVTVEIRVPSRIDVTNKVHEHLIDSYLATIGIRNALTRSSPLNLWSLYPWRHPISTWRTVFGTDTDRLVQRRVLFPTRLDSVQSPDHPGAGRILVAEPLPGGEYQGVSQMAEIPSRALTPTDLDGLELDPEAFQRELRESLGLSGSAPRWDGTELLDLGVLTIEQHEFRLSYALRPPLTGADRRMRERAPGATPVLLVPADADGTSELPKVVLDGALPTLKGVRRGVIAACGLGDSMPAVHVAPDGARLVVDTRLGKVWLDGIEVTGLRAGTHPFRLVEVLARACPRPVNTDNLSSELSGARSDGDTTARQAKLAAKKAILAAMTGAGRSFEEEPFPTGHPGSYRSALPAFVL